MGDKCHFAHGQEELRQASDVRFWLWLWSPYPRITMKRRNLATLSTSSNSSSIMEELAKAATVFSKPSNASISEKVAYLYIIWIGQACPYGVKCTFAHGDNELRRVNDPPMAGELGMYPVGYQDMGGYGDPNMMYYGAYPDYSQGADYMYNPAYNYMAPPVYEPQVQGYYQISLD